jgi:photosystem II stability/assembly factor-like uncharacterized protein
MSSDGGDNWTEVRPAGLDQSFYYNSCDVSPDGQYMILSQYGGRVYVSRDGGANWVEVQPKGNVDASWTCCRAAAVGIMMCSDTAAPEIWSTHDAGITWQSGTSTAMGGWNNSDLSRDGQRFIMAAGPAGRAFRGTL